MTLEIDRISVYLGSGNKYVQDGTSEDRRPMENPMMMINEIGEECNNIGSDI